MWCGKLNPLVHTHWEWTLKQNPVWVKSPTNFDETGLISRYESKVGWAMSCVYNNIVILMWKLTSNCSQKIFVFALIPVLKDIVNIIVNITKNTEILFWLKSW